MSVAHPIVTTHITDPHPANAWTVVAVEGFEEVVLEAELVVAATVAPDVEDGEEVAVEGSVESAASAVYDAERPVTFVQMPGGAILPATKLTAAHCNQEISITFS